MHKHGTPRHFWYLCMLPFSPLCRKIEAAGFIPDCFFSARRNNMDSFEEQYQKAIENAVQKKVEDNLRNPEMNADYDKYQLDCLLNPDKHADIEGIADCICENEEKGSLGNECFFASLEADETGKVTVNPAIPVGCTSCLMHGKPGNPADRKELLPVFELLNHSDVPVYALIAPAYISQFSEEVTPGKLRSTFKHLGFAGMIEVALFADILTMKEAMEFDRSIKTDKDFMLTSCCCPMWIAMIRKVYGQLVPHIPPSVSPMIASGRAIKLLHPEAKTVFIGPCIAKKAEAREKDVAGAIDYVLTFQEVQDILDMTGIRPEQEKEDLRDHSSTSGRIYARAGGVSTAVQSTLDRLHPNRPIPLKAERADGVPACKALLEKIKEGRLESNFIEGMGCAGGCVGGPKALIPRDEGRDHVNKYGLSASSYTPIDNPYVMDLLHRLGIDSIDALLEDTRIFSRHFDS